MNKFKIEFQNLEWHKTAVGAQEKQFHSENKRIRLLRLDDSFKEEDWCTNGHLGYVLQGQLTIQFNTEKIHYTAGDGLFIKGGIEQKHKALVEKGKFVELVLFESVAN